MADDPKTHFQRFRDALARKDVTQVDAELGRLAKYLGKQMLNPKLDDVERLGVFALGMATAAARRVIKPKRKK